MRLSFRSAKAWPLPNLEKVQVENADFDVRPVKTLPRQASHLISEGFNLLHPMLLL